MFQKAKLPNRIRVTAEFNVALDISSDFFRVVKFGLVS